MADKIVTAQKLKDADKDCDALDQAVSGGDSEYVRTRRGKEYPTMPNAIRQIMENGGFMPFATEAELLAYVPNISPSAAKAMDTKKVWLWKNDSWHDTGLSELDQAKDFTRYSLEQNMGGVVLKGIIKKDRGLTGAIGNNDAAISQTPNGICFEFQAEPNTTYSFKKNESRRFRIAEFPMDPPAGGWGNMLYIGQDRESPNPQIQQEAIVTTSSTTKSIIVYVTNNNEDVALRVVKANHPTLETPVEITSPSLRVTKNICQNVTLTDRFFSNLGQTEIIATTDKIQLVIQPVKPNTTYTLSRKGGNRFRVALSPTYAIFGSKVNCIYIQDDLRYMPQSYTFKTASDTNFAMFMLSNNAKDIAYDIQLEEGLTASEFKPFGVSFKDLLQPFPIGDAHYFDANQWYKNEALTIPANDDTLELQRLFNKGGHVTLDPTRVYYITDTVTLDVRKIKYFNGFGALIVIKGDIDGILIKGGHNSISHPTNVGRNVYWDKDGVVTGLRCVPAVKGQGNGIVIEQCIGLRFYGNAASLFKKGVSLRKYTRDLIMFGNQIWSNDECNLYFDPTCNLHQSVIFGNIMTYARRCIWWDGCEIYNQIVANNTLETAENPIFDSSDIRIPEAIIYMDANGKTLGGVQIECNGIEDHAISKRNIRLQARNGGQLLNVTVNGGLATSSQGSEVEYGALDDESLVSGITLSGFTSNSTAGAALIKQIGHIGKVKINGINYTGSRLYECDGDFIIGQLTINDCETSVGSSFANIMIKARSANVIKIQDNTLAVSGNITTTNVIDINLAESSRIVAVKGNVFVASDTVPSNKMLVNIQGNIKKTAITENISDLESAQYLSNTTGVSVISNND